MQNLITAGLDGSSAGAAAAEWAAHEAELRDAALELVHADDWPQYAPFAAPLPEARRHWADELLARTRDRLLREHPALDIRTRRIDGLAPNSALVSAAGGTDLLVLGTRGLGPIAGFLVGSVGAATVPATDTPVVLVRAAADTSGPPAPSSPDSAPVVVGLDLRSNCDGLVAFAADEADRRACPLVVVHGWSPPPMFSYAPSLDPGISDEIADGLQAALRELLKPWEQKYPALGIEACAVIGQPAVQILDAAAGAALVVVGRRIRHSATGPHIGSITHAVMHHATCPVAVVAHD
ncbi:universal stress protein [Streptomyces roseus]|uniref:universal stress protein n=1 Tax=Streptomyces roseus TaxID=66430 RepID=UPI003818CA1E